MSLVPERGKVLRWGEEPHSCLPDEGFDQWVPRGTIWQCDCGQRWVQTSGQRHHEAWAQVPPVFWKIWKWWL